MTSTAVILLAVSAVMHAWWNLRSKRRHPSAAQFLVADGTVCVCLLPVALYHHAAISLLPARLWVLVAATGLCQAVYYSALANAYRRGHMSMAYPLARAVPIVLVAAGNLLVGRGHQIGAVGLAGMGVVTAGCLVLPMEHFRDLGLRKYLHASCVFALLAALGTAGYMTIDDAALRLLRGLPGMPMSSGAAALLYVPLLTLSTVTWLGLFVACSAGERAGLKTIAREAKGYTAVTGLAIWAAYGLVLVSMGYVSNVSYVVAFRQLSIPVGAGLGIVVLGEARHAPRLVGVAVLFVGLVMVALG